MISSVEGYLLNTTRQAYNGRDANKNRGSKCPKLITSYCLYCTVPRVLEVIYVSLSVYGTVLRISARLCAIHHGGSRAPAVVGAFTPRSWAMLQVRVFGFLLFW